MFPCEIRFAIANEVWPDHSAVTWRNTHTNVKNDNLVCQVITHIIVVVATVPFLYYPGLITCFALQIDAGIVSYIYFEAPGLSGIAENKVWCVAEQWVPTAQSIHLGMIWCHRRRANNTHITVFLLRFNCYWEHRAFIWAWSNVTVNMHRCIGCQTEKFGIRLSSLLSISITTRLHGDKFKPGRPLQRCIGRQTENIWDQDVLTVIDLDYCYQAQLLLSSRPRCYQARLLNTPARW